MTEASRAARGRERVTEASRAARVSEGGSDGGEQDCESE